MLSPRTVEQPVAQVLRKLRVTRNNVKAAVTETGMTGEAGSTAVPVRGA